MVALCVIYFALRVLHIAADPPLKMPNGFHGYELIVEGPAKAYEARNRAVFGRWTTNPVDNYHFWRAQSPAWVYPLSGWFRVFGATTVNLRIYSVLVATVGFALLLALLSRQMALGLPLLFGAAFLGLNHYYIHASRAGLLEIQLNTLLAGVALALFAARKNLLWLIAMHWLLLAAFLTKQSAIVMLPVGLVGSVAVHLVAYRRHAATKHHLAACVHGLVLLVGLLLYIRTDAYWRSVLWNFGHVLEAKQGASAIDIGVLGNGSWLRRLLSLKRWKTQFFWYFPLAGPLALLGLISLGWRMLRERRVAAWPALIGGWFICALLAVQVTPWRYLRFYLVLFPPVALLAAWYLQQLFQRLRSASARHGLAALLCLGIGSSHVNWYLSWASDARYVGRSLSDKLRRAIGDQPAVVVGAWAVPIAFDTAYECYYVKEVFNATRPALRGLSPTHLLWKQPRGWTRGIVTRLFPHLKRRRPDASWKAWGSFRVQFHAVDPEVWKPHRAPRPAVRQP
jgi:hypothetical protein